MAERSIFRRLVDLALPVIGLNVLNVLALAVDTAMIGRMDLAEPALAGLGFATQLIFLLMVGMMGLTVGTVAFVARAWGAGEPERVNHILLQSGMLTGALSILVAVFGNLLAEPACRWMGAQGAALDFAVDYLRPLLVFVIFNYLNLLYAAVLRGVGNTRLAFVAALVSNLLNVVLNYGLILGNLGLPAMGVQGAAIGTTISQAVAVTLMVVLVRRGGVPGVTIRLLPEAFDKEMAKELIRVGWPAAADMIVFNAGFLTIVGLLGRIDEAAVAAHGIGLRIQALAFVPGMSIAQATGAMVGNALGAGKIEEAKAVFRAGLLLCLAIMSGLGAILIGLDMEILAIFDVTRAGSLEAYSSMWIHQLGWCMPFVAVWVVVVGLLQGSGDTRKSLRINVVAILAFQIPLSWILGFPMGLGAFGVWLAFPLSLLIKAVWGALIYREGSWARVGTRA